MVERRWFTVELPTSAKSDEFFQVGGEINTLDAAQWFLSNICHFTASLINRGEIVEHVETTIRHKTRYKKGQAPSPAISALNQTAIWVPKRKKGQGGIRVPYSGPKPEKLWTLIQEASPDEKPPLPMFLQHRRNAFFEDEIHDWRVDGDCIIYSSRVSDGGCWIVIETKIDRVERK